ncbi:hypothetical protein GIR22_11480 [Pseudomonas sp. CCM 7891]|uniref:Uncharacterized protein n=1 Tax=Pseudomonas karstica TaxID=1055468 RepID=A0A7X2RRN3_9PSED|nr:hypothetical protein [Pseudomonas karstica]MTD19743.1 hypothetical protein [Pseudomonas karstica]
MNGTSASPRQMNANATHKVMAEMGVYFNDFGTFARANRFERPIAVTEALGGNGLSRLQRPVDHL